jgi:inner membrane protein
MPSPIVHSLVGWVIARGARGARAATGRRPAPTILAGVLIAASNAPDLDFIPGLIVGEFGRFHRGATHSLLAASIIGLVVAWLATRLGWESPQRLGFLAGLAATTHVMLDMLSIDQAYRHGAEVFWPLYRDGVAFPLTVFVDLTHDPTAPTFAQAVLHRHNAFVFVRETIIIAAAVATARIVSWMLARQRRRAADGSAG